MKYKHWTLSPIFLALAACGGGGSDSPTPEVEDPPVIEDPVEEDVTPLDLPDDISILLASDDSGTNNKNRFKANNDFENDEKRVHVWDEAMQPLQMVNEILCYVSQTGADQIVNETYTALVDTERCRTEESDEDTGQSSGNTESFQLWTIESSRESNDAPQTVRIWVPAEGSDENGDPMDQQRILVEVTIDSEGDESNPYGQFIMNWKGVVDMNGNDMQTMHGTIQASVDSDGRPNILFFDEGGSEEMGFTFSEATNILMDSAESQSGIAKTAFEHSEPNGTFGAQFSVAYDQEYYLRGKDTDLNGEADEQMCFARNEFDQFVWRYNLYNSSDLSRVELNSGFPFYTDIGDNRYFGHIGYWGMWLPEEVDMSQVTEIVKQNYDDNSTATYDVLHAPGKLVKRVKTSLPLEEIEGVYLEYGDLRVEYTHDFELNSGDQVGEPGFYAIARRTEASDGTVDFEPIEPYVLTDDHMFFWSQALGGGVNYDAFHDDTSVTIYEESYVRSTADLDGSASALQLDCYHQCLKSNISSDQINYNNDSPYIEGNGGSNGESTGPAVTYSFNFDTLTLEDPEGNPVALAADANVGENSPHYWGIQTGAMVVAGTTVEDGRDVWNADVSYFWETGHNHWNQTTVVSESGSDALVEFDKPINFLYTHTTANDINADENNPSPFDGQSYMLNYGGAGKLWGIPHEQGENNRYGPLFSIADGTSLADDSYVVKGIDVEQRLRSVENNLCSANELSLDNISSLELPDASDITAVTITWDDKPTVDDAPRVIGGEIQE